MATILDKGTVKIEFTKIEFDSLVELLGAMDNDDLRRFLGGDDVEIEDKVDALITLYADLS